MPPVGLGLWKSAKGEVGAAVRSALETGYRLLDGAAAYGNEAEVGEALAAAIADGVVARDDVFVVSKLFNTHHVWKDDRSRPAAALAKTLADLRLERLDAWLMHWPFAFEQTDLGAIGGLRGPDGTPNPKLVLAVEFVETWREMVALQAAGMVRHLGVCNFTVEQLKALLAAFPQHPPAINQVELHPYLAQPELVSYCEENGIRLMAYSPLGSGDSYSGASFPKRGSGRFETPSGGAPLLQNEVVAEVAARRGATAAQVLIRWGMQKGFASIPKSVKPERIEQNFRAASSIELSAEDMDALATLDCGFRYGIGYGPGHYDCPNAPWSK